MALFFADIERDLFSLLRFLFLCHVQIFSCEILLDNRSKYPCSIIMIIILLFWESFTPALPDGFSPEFE